MNADRRPTYCLAGMGLFIYLLLLLPLPAYSFSQQGGKAETAAGNGADSITMQTVAGRVIETMNSGGYTYALVAGDANRTWVALPESRIAVGSEIACKPGMMMNNFNSPSLQRTFSRIVFSGGITSISGNPAPATEPPAETEPVQHPRVKDASDWQEFFD